MSYLLLLWFTTILKDCFQFFWILAPGEAILDTLLLASLHVVGFL